jgi:hypothetical protein
LHRGNINRCATGANIASRRALRDPPHPALAHARATFPREGGRGSRPINLADARRDAPTVGAAREETFAPIFCTR